MALTDLGTDMQPAQPYKQGMVEQYGMTPQYPQQIGTMYGAMNPSGVPGSSTAPTLPYMDATGKWVFPDANGMPDIPDVPGAGQLPPTQPGMGGLS